MRELPNHDTAIPSLVGTLTDALRQSLSVKETGAGIAGLSWFAHNDLVKGDAGFGHLEYGGARELGCTVEQAGAGCISATLCG